MVTVFPLVRHYIHLVGGISVQGTAQGPFFKRINTSCTCASEGKARRLFYTSVPSCVCGGGLDNWKWHGSERGLLLDTRVVYISDTDNAYTRWKTKQRNINVLLI